MKKYLLSFSFTFLLLLVNQLSFVAEANAFLNGVPNLLTASDQTVDKIFGSHSDGLSEKLEDGIPGFTGRKTKVYNKRGRAIGETRSGRENSARPPHERTRGRETLFPKELPPGNGLTRDFPFRKTS